MLHDAPKVVNPQLPHNQAPANHVGTHPGQIASPTTTLARVVEFVLDYRHRKLAEQAQQDAREEQSA